MTLASKTLAELAKLRAGIGPVRTAQAGSPYVSGGPVPIVTDNSGVDTSGALIANLIIEAVAVDCVGALHGRSEGSAGFDILDGFDSVTVTAGTRRKFRVECESEDELFFVCTSTGAGTQVWIEPCTG